jgi:hypothetical protein
MSREFELYADILSEFCDVDENPNAREVWKVNSIIKLMNFAKQLDDCKNIVQTGLLLIMHLATGKYHDDVEAYGRNLKDLLNYERDYVIASLKSEFN